MRCPTCKRDLPPPATICPHDGAFLLAPLADTLKRGPLPLSEAARMAERVCLLLEQIHKQGLVHARIVPENIFFRHVGSDLTVRITDPDEVRPLPPARYATPERVRGEREDARADIYALGVLLHHMIAGAPPFDSGTEAAILKKHAEAEPGTLLALELQDVPEELDALIKRMLAKQASARPESVGEVREALENIDTGSTITGARIAALGVAASAKDTDPGAGGGVLDEPTIETAPVFDVTSRESQNPTLFNVEKQKPAPVVPDESDHPTSLEVDPYGDTVLRMRPKLGVGPAPSDEGDAETRLKITPRVVEPPPPIAPLPRPADPARSLEPRSIEPRVAEPRALESRAVSDATEPPPGPRPPDPRPRIDASPRGPTVRNAPRAEQQAKLALLVLIAALGFVVVVLSIVLITR